LKKWLHPFLSLYLFLSTNICFAQFNSIVKVETSIPVSITRSNFKGVEFDTLKRSYSNETEDLKKAPVLIKLTNLDKAEALIASKLGAHLPIDQFLLRSSFGYRIHPVTKKYTFHTGIDMAARSENIYSVLHGRVNESSYNPKLGNYISINHGNYTTVYGHLSKSLVVAGELVKPGEVIGISGKTGVVTGEHLHFTVKYKGNLIEPLIFLSTIMTAKPNDLYLALFN
jgi:murein DD-endopeptidase MepM/ murein hydrolase activator NlpD